VAEKTAEERLEESVCRFLDQPDVDALLAGLAGLDHRRLGGADDALPGDAVVDQRLLDDVDACFGKGGIVAGRRFQAGPETCTVLRG